MSGAGYAVARPRLELLEVLASIAAYQDSRWIGNGPRWGRAGAWCIVRQQEIIKWYARMLTRYGRPAGLATICRRTLNYQLAGLVRARYIERVQRHKGERGTRKLSLRPSLYKFSGLGRLWIKRTQGWIENPVTLSAVQKTAQSGLPRMENSLTSLSSVVDKAPTTGARKPAAARRSADTLTSSAVRPPGKAPIRKVPRPRRKAQTTRSATKGGTRGGRRQRRA